MTHLWVMEFRIESFKKSLLSVAAKSTKTSECVPNSRWQVMFCDNFVLGMYMCHNVRCFCGPCTKLLHKSLLKRNIARTVATHLHHLFLPSVMVAWSVVWTDPKSSHGWPKPATIFLTQWAPWLAQEWALTSPKPTRTCHSCPWGKIHVTN
jgi:hypothetical protein